MDRPLNPAGRPEVQLDPALQARLMDQMRAEQAAAERKRMLRNYVAFPAIGMLAIVGVFMALYSTDPTTSMVGNILASGILYVIWKLRKRIGSALGF